MTERTLRIAICDDTPMEAELLAARLEAYGQGLEGAGQPGVAVQTFYDTAALELALDDGQRYDLTFMDIVLPGEDGVRFVRRQRAAGRSLPVVFLSNSTEYDAEAMALGALACLEKPVKKAALFPLLDELRQAAPPPARVEATARDGSRFALCDILFLQRVEAGWQCRLADGRTALCRADDAAIALWLARPDVAWVSGVLAVAMDKITGFTPKAMTLCDGTALKVPWTKQREWSARYLAYMAGRCGQK